MLTAEVVRTGPTAPFHLRSEGELDGVWVSPVSRWRDPVWRLNNPSVGQSPRASTVTWRMALPDGGNLIDREHASLLAWLRRFVWGLLVDPRDIARAYKPGSAAMLTQGLRVVVPWMVARRETWPKQMDKAFVAAFVDDLPSLVAKDAVDDEAIKEGAIYMPLKIIDLFWRQREALADAGIEPMPERPWNDEKGANTIVKRIATEARGWIRPVPDEVAIPLVNRTAWFLGAPADDVLALRARIEEASHRVDGSETDERSYQAMRLRRVQKRLCDFSFSTVDGESLAWHEPLMDFVPGKRGRFGPTHRVRQLASAVISAACITIQSSTGMRASEICALRAGTDPKTGLPHGVGVVEAPSGLNEAFVLRSELTKEQVVPRDVDWLLGLRPKGTHTIPLPVRAMLVLDRLLAPERQLAGTTRLLVSFTTPHSFPRRKTSVTVFNGLQLDKMVKRFIERWVDLSRLPDESAHRISPKDLVPWRESKGRILRPHQFRKTYAQFALSVDPRLLPAVQRQFHHVALAITEGSYWGRNRIQIEPLNAMASQLTAMQMYEMATGRTKAIGKMGVRLEERMGEVRKLIEGAGVEVGWRRVVRFVRDNDLHMWFAPHGDCFPLNPEHMSCHNAAGTHSVGLPIPNFGVREPSLCVGCKCFILDRRHIGFWQDRYVNYLLAYKQAERRGQGNLFRVVAARAAVAKKLLRRLDVDLAPLDLRVERELADAEH